MRKFTVTQDWFSCFKKGKMSNDDTYSLSTSFSRMNKDSEKICAIVLYDQRRSTEIAARFPGRFVESGKLFLQHYIAHAHTDLLVGLLFAKNDLISMSHALNSPELLPRFFFTNEEELGRTLF